MNIIVCVKEILDPEIPAKAFRIDPELKRALRPSDIELVISDYDERAVEAALQIKDSQDSKITILSLGAESARDTIRRCIAMGADEGLLLSDPLFDDTDSCATAQVLAAAIKKLGDFDLILCGRQEGDWDAGQVGSGIAEILGLPSVTRVGRINVDEGQITVERIVDDGRDIVELPLPALITVSSEIGEARYPSIRRVREASKKEIPVWNSHDVPPAKPKNKMISLTVPVRESRCEFIAAETPEESGYDLASKLKEANLI